MRIHVFEFLDQAWLPDVFRKAMTAYLPVAYSTTPFPKLWAAQIRQALAACGENDIVDLGSGSAGPLLMVAAELKSMGVTPRITLTDLFPTEHSVKLAGDMSCLPKSVDARAVPPELIGLRTMFAAFHHFRPADAAGILKDAFVSNRAICIFEGTARTPTAIAVSFLIPLMVLCLTPSIRPRSGLQWLLTYVVPVLPFMMFWDGFVSQFRTYSVAELNAITAPLNSTGYTWDIGTISAPRVPFAVPYLIGTPAKRTSS